MANGSIESKDEGSSWPADGSSQSLPSSQQPQDTGTLGDPNDNFSQAASHLPPLLHPRPPSPVSVAELQERAVQDSQNNNVDENSNDHHLDQYAAAAVASAYPSWQGSSIHSYQNEETMHHSSFNRDVSSYPPYSSREAQRPSCSSRGGCSGLSWEMSSHNVFETSRPSSTSRESLTMHTNRGAAHQKPQSRHDSNSSHSTQNTSCSGHPPHPVQEAFSASDQSVRPRVRQSSQHRRDEPDLALPPRLRTAPRRDSFSSSGCQHSGRTHRRNHSDGMTPATRYPPLPNHNCPSNESGKTCE